MGKFMSVMPIFSLFMLSLLYISQLNVYGIASLIAASSLLYGDEAASFSDFIAEIVP